MIIKMEIFVVNVLSCGRQGWQCEKEEETHALFINLFTTSSRWDKRCECYRDATGIVCDKVYYITRWNSNNYYPRETSWNSIKFQHLNQQEIHDVCRIKVNFVVKRKYTDDDFYILLFRKLFVAQEVEIYQSEIEHIYRLHVVHLPTLVKKSKHQLLST